jgi:NAD(P)-dependent dehydrogenase (short-subunit alcohol dehydrogenase family)
VAGVEARARADLDNGGIVTTSSDATDEPYAGWGGYGSSKAALDELTSVLAEEHPTLRVSTPRSGSAPHAQGQHPTLRVYSVIRATCARA